MEINKTEIKKKKQGRLMKLRACPLKRQTKHKSSDSLRKEERPQIKL